MLKQAVWGQSVLGGMVGQQAPGSLHTLSSLGPGCPWPCLLVLKGGPVLPPSLLADIWKEGRNHYKRQEEGAGTRCFISRASKALWLGHSTAFLRPDGTVVASTG